MQRVWFLMILLTVVSSREVANTEQISGEAYMVKHSINFTKHWIKSVNGQDVDIEDLIWQHALICPIEHRCSADGPDVYRHDNFTDRANITFKECPKCDCNPGCRQNRSCCMDSPYGYLDYECVNVAMFPENSDASFYMIARCPDKDGLDQDLISQCRDDDINPVTSKETGLVYRNGACAKCHDETSIRSWEITVQCLNSTETEDVKQFSSVAELKRKIVEKDCKIAYFLSQPEQPYMIPAACTRDNSLFWNSVERCNVTGLWKNYNQAIDWACRNLNSQFMIFKNVFCYICNPSTSSLSPPEGTIDSCNTTGRWEHYNNLIEHLCLTLPSIERLAPFKNVYCMLCNGIHSANVSDRFHTSYINTSISEFVYYYLPESTIVSDLEINITFTDANLILAMKSFMGKTYGTKISSHRPNLQSPPKRGIVPEAVTMSYLNELKSVCGGRNLCEESLSMLGISPNDTLGSNEFCENCTCELSCGEDGNCCQDILFRKRPYLCLENDHILTVPEDDEHVIADRISAYHRFNSYSLVVDTCLSSEIGPASDFCTGENGFVDELSYIPVITEPDKRFQKKIAYKNIHCLLCNVNHHRTITITLQLVCNNFLEAPLFTDIVQLLQHTKTYCRTSFVAKYSQECRNNVMDEIDYTFYGRPPIWLRNNDLSPGLHTLLEHLYGNGTDTVSKDFTACNQSGNWDGEEALLQDVCELDDSDQSLLSLPRYRINKIKYMNFACFACNPDADEKDLLPDGPISQCNLTGGWDQWDNVTEELCLDSEQVSYWLPFKNMHCSSCNHGPIVRWGVKSETEDNDDVLVYRRLFSLTFDDWDFFQKTTNDVTCDNGMYDHITMSCRQFYCSQGYFLFNRVCRRSVLAVEKVVLKATLYLNKHPDCYRYRYSSTPSTCPYNDASNVALNFNDIVEEITLKVMSRLDNNTIANLDSYQGFVDVSCAEPYIFQIHDVTNIEINFELFVLKTDNLTHVLDSVVNAQLGKYIVNSTSGMPVELFAADIKIYTPPFHLGCGVGRRSPRFFPEFDLYGTEAEDKDDETPAEINASKFLICPQVQLSESEFIQNNMSDGIVLATVNASFEAGDYFFVNDSFLRMCVDTYDKVTLPFQVKQIPQQTTSRMKTVYTVFSLICTCLSLICLFLTFLAYCILQQLRTVPGQNNMALCFCLFFAQLILQFGLKLIDNSNLCISMGILIHFFWLATFCAMNVCSFHMFKVFCFKQLRATVSVHRARYLGYIIGVPSFIISLTVLVHLLLSDMAFCGYGKNFCFLSDVYSTIAAFFVPATLIFTSNIVFFAVTFYKIRTRPSVQSSVHRSDLFIYIKLSTLIGVAWPLQFVDALFELSVFSFFVVAINALQGVFIFLSYICNARVASLLMTKVRPAASSNASSTGTKRTTNKNTYFTDTKSVLEEGEGSHNMQGPLSTTL